MSLGRVILYELPKKGGYFSGTRRARIFMEFTPFAAANMPPTPDDYVRENIEPTLTKGLEELCRARPSSPCTWLAE